MISQPRFFISGYTVRMTVIAEGSVRFAHFGPSHNLLRPAVAELVSCGPLPLPVSAGGHASAIPAILALIKDASLCSA